jgi:hypothetical protein
VGGLRAAVERLLRNPDLRRRLGAAGRAEAIVRFAWPAVIDATMLAYRTALADEPVEAPAAIGQTAAA